MTPDTGDKRPHVYNITVNSTGQSGHAVDAGEEAAELTVQDIKKWTPEKMKYEMAQPGGKEKINKALQNRKKK